MPSCRRPPAMRSAAPASSAMYSGFSYRMSMTAVPISIRLVFAPHRRQQRKRRAELAGEVMHAEVGPVRAELLGRDGQVDRLQQRVGRRSRLRLGRRRPMAE